MTEGLKRIILKAAGILQKFGAGEVFFFGSVARAGKSNDQVIDLAVSTMPPENYFIAMGEVLSAVRRKCNIIDLDEENPYVEYLKSHGKTLPDIDSKIKNEFTQIHEMFQTYRSLFYRVHCTEPTDTELVALAGILQMMYSGFDKIFRFIINEIDGDRCGLFYDADILERMAVTVPGRTPVLSTFLVEQLRPYLSFRNVFSNPYSHNISWKKMKALVLEAGEILLLVEAELNRFLEDNC